MEGMLGQVQREVEEAAVGFASWFDEHGIFIIATIATAVVVTIVVSLLVRRYRKRLEGSPSLTQELNLQRIATLTGALSTTGIVVIWVVAVLMILENQFGVADVVEVRTTANPVSGKVESLTLRVTTLRDFDGTLHIIPNGNIQLVSNKSRGWARAIVDVRVAYGEDVDRALRERIPRRLDAEGFRTPIPPTIAERPGEPAR